MLTGLRVVLAKKENQVDYHYQIREWFGHYLRGDEPAKWIIDGQKHLDRQKEIERMKFLNDLV